MPDLASSLCRLAIASLLALVLACTSPPPGPEPEPELAVERATSPEPPTLHAPIRPPTPASESAYFLGPAIARLADREWTSVEPPTDGVADQPFHLFMGTDGRVYAHNWHRIARLDGDRLEPLASVDEELLIQDVAVGGSGELAVMTSRPQRSDAASERVLHLLRDGRWSGAPTDHEHWPFSQTAAFDRFGNLWTWQRSVLRSEWHWPTLTERSAAISLPAPRVAVTIAASPTGDIYAFVDGAAHRISDTAQVEVPLPGLTRPDRALVGASGNFVLAWTDCTIMRITASDPPRIETIDVTTDGRIDKIGLAIDARDRVWVATESALWVVPPAGAPSKYTIGTIPGSVTGATDIAVVGRGPELPPPGPIPTTAIRGTVAVEANWGPIADRMLVLRSLSKRSDGAHESVFRTLSDRRGDFAFVGIPVDRYSLETEDGALRWSLEWEVDTMLDAGIVELGEPNASDLLLGK